ncbi:MAG TPA: hypothetical protein VFV75_19745 [Candidatus Polarisedimenticolaceae bacterium]|nr:hypothetical protein [Candidatus Polarisedimenticolaceae bacterium]
MASVTGWPLRSGHGQEGVLGLTPAILRLFFGVALVLLASGFTLAQDADLDPILFADLDGAQVEEVTASSFAVYRIPISYRLRSLDDHPWGMRLTFPVSLGTYRIRALNEVDEFIEDLQSVSVIPGVECEVPAGQRWVLKPFAEVGIGTDSGGGGTDVLWGTGLRATGAYRRGRTILTVGSAAIYKEPATSRTSFDSYSKLEAGLDARWPLGFSVGRRSTSGGIFGITRRYFDLDLERLGQDPLEVEQGYEVGLSFGTDPAIRVVGIEFPWVGLGYAFGEVFGGVRLYLSFPF